jgi:hypothetical protein
VGRKEVERGSARMGNREGGKAEGRKEARAGGRLTLAVDVEREDRVQDLDGILLEDDVPEEVLSRGGRGACLLAHDLTVVCREGGREGGRDGLDRGNRFLKATEGAVENKHGKGQKGGKVGGRAEGRAHRWSW